MLNFIAIGPWTEDQVSASLIESTRRIVESVESTIQSTWTEHVAQLGSAIFDGPMCRLESWEKQEAKLTLVLSRTSYRIFLGTNLCHAELADRFGRDVLANAVGMSVALRTGDGNLVLGRRNDRVAYYPNRIHPFAGALEPGDVPNVFDGIRRELAEELSLPRSEISDLKMLAILEDQQLLQPEFIFAARTSRTTTQLQNSLDPSEHDAIWICEASQIPLEKLLNSIDAAGQSEAGEQFTPVAVGTLLMHGRELFGAQWFGKHAKKFT